MWTFLTLKKLLWWQAITCFHQLGITMVFSHTDAWRWWSCAQIISPFPVNLYKVDLKGEGGNEMEANVFQIGSPDSTKTLQLFPGDANNSWCCPYLCPLICRKCDSYNFHKSINPNHKSQISCNALSWVIEFSRSVVWVPHPSFLHPWPDEWWTGAWSDRAPFPFFLSVSLESLELTCPHLHTPKKRKFFLWWVDHYTVGSKIQNQKPSCSCLSGEANAGAGTYRVLFDRPCFMLGSHPYTPHTHRGALVELEGRSPWWILVIQGPPDNSLYLWPLSQPASSADIQTINHLFPAHDGERQTRLFVLYAGQVWI